MAPSQKFAEGETEEKKPRKPTFYAWVYRKNLDEVGNLTEVGMAILPQAECKYPCNLCYPYAIALPSLSAYGKYQKRQCPITEH